MRVTKIALTSVVIRNLTFVPNTHTHTHTHHEPTLYYQDHDEELQQMDVAALTEGSRADIIARRGSNIRQEQRVAYGQYNAT